MMQQIKAKGDPAAEWQSFTSIHDPVLHVKHVQGMLSRKEIPFLSLCTTFLGSWSQVCSPGTAAKVAGRGTERTSYLGS